MDNRVVKLYYHTGTGNSLKIAKDIGSKLGDHELNSIALVYNEETGKFTSEGSKTSYFIASNGR